MNGCTNPAAVNYNTAADVDDGSCIYLNKVGVTCYEFHDVSIDEITDKSFTLSWAVEGNNWVFFHDYIPDFYFQTREKLYSLKNKAVWKHNQGPVGKFYGTNPSSFLIDVVFTNDEEVTLNSINWITEVFDQLGIIQEQSTLTHITIWNSYQCSERIALSNFTPLPATSPRKTESQFFFNDFRDCLINRTGGFLNDLFSNRSIKAGRVDMNQNWYDLRLFEDKYFVVRFEFDNIGNKLLSLHSVDIDINQSVR